MTSRERRKARAEELRSMADVLDRSGLCSDISPLHASASECMRPPQAVPLGSVGTSQNAWGYNMSNLRINLSEMKHLRPIGTLASGLIGQLSVSVEELTPEDDDEDFDEFNAIQKVEVDFVCESLLEIEGESHHVRSAWHLDTDLFPDTISHSVHPRFHFQFGGRGLEGVDVRGVFIPEQPRLAHPPLDAVLAIDFVLSHYCGDIWKSQRLDDSRYARMIEPACRRYLYGYYREISDFFTRPVHSVKPSLAMSLYPNLC